MSRAAELARSARLVTPPNPWVGCVLVADGEIVGEGATGPYPGGPHAEVAALLVAGARAQDATAYVTLEPCNHQGNTPPCTDALIAAGVGRVVIAVEDPDDRVRGNGIERLRAASIEIQPLDVSHAFHSCLVDPVLDEVERSAGSLGARAPTPTCRA
jgi:diaminohydroxyphosphoribosylaminopyrimidine deaminase/5-amino-6-(5-phosphoribosylamino)uracil reductase